MCQTFFSFWFGISRTSVTVMKNRIEEGAIRHDPHFGKKRKRSGDCETMIAFMSATFNKLADLHPVKKKRVLQSSYTKQKIYDTYVQSVVLNNNAIPISRAQFYKTWNDQFPDVIIHKYCPFAECTTCEEFKRKKREALTLEDHKRLEVGLATHQKLFT